ncbi:MAG: hypothetical protein OJF50_006104 [Nitrospira sp.]|nr:hypothetical protein [Nitrospira sp.]
MKRPRVSKLMVGAMALACAGITLPAQAQVTPFQILGHIESFCLNNQIASGTGACLTTADKEALVLTPADPRTVGATTATPLIGARIVVSGIAVTIPVNTVVQMPAAYLTPQQIFARAQGVSKKYNESGLALQDKFPPLAAFEVAIDGNIVNNTYIAGLVRISQQSLNNGAGYIHGINLSPPPDHSAGKLCIGPNPLAITCQPGDVMIRLNDPALPSSDPFPGDGRYGRPNPNPPNTEKPNPAPPPAPAMIDDPNSRFPDPRFTVDQGNPTVHALTGYPMCVPRSAVDSECPSVNRPAGLTTFVMHTEPLIPPAKFASQPIQNCAGCDPDKQAPFIVGDYITYAGTLAQDADGPFVSVHTMVGNVGIYTKPGGRAYVTLEESLVGTNGPVLVCGSIAECQNRLKVEGFSTDPSRKVNVYAIDVNASTGAQTARLLHGTEKVQAVFGRFRYVPPLTVAGLHDLNGTLMGVTRELMVRIDDGTPFPDGSPLPSTPVTAHGLVAGIYVAPVGEYIFPEPTGVQGGPQPALNFQCLAFLVNGWSLPELPAIPRLAPWPGSEPPAFSCTN